MKNLDGSYPVTMDGSMAGTLNVFSDGGFTSFEFRGDSCGSTPVRLCCRSGERIVPIGIPVPEKGMMYLRKRFTRNGLESAGISGIDGCMLISLSKPIPSAPVFVDTHFSKPADITPQSGTGAWQCEYEPWSIFTDEEIQLACRGLNGALRRSCGDTEELAIPVSPNEPFPMMPVFCYGDIAEINGRQYVVFTVKGGKLV